MIFQFTLQHDHGLATVTLYEQNSEESAIKSIMAIERCPRRSIIKIEDLTPNTRTTPQTTRIS
jgi:hypothetical protein